jgi:hypothetical protein
MNALQGLAPSPRKDITTMSVIDSIAEGCARSMAEDLPSFMDKYVFDV